MKILENISLKQYNTFSIEQKARFFVAVSSLDDLKAALQWAKDEQLEVLILGGGSNLLLTRDFPGLVIRIELKGIAVLKENSEEVLAEVGAGEVWHDWVQYTIDKGWAGIENLSLIPGTVGASPMQNIGAYGVEIKEVFQSLKALNRETLEITEFDAESCNFGYRESVFKHEMKGQFVITSVVFSLKKQATLKLEYGAIRETLEAKGITNPGIRDVSQAVIEIRQSKLPNPKEIGNAGSFFKNPTISEEHFATLKNAFPTIPGYPNEEGVKVPAGWLIEQAGWKGKRQGEVGVHAKQALVLVNFGNGKGEEIKNLASEIQKSIQSKFGIELQPEVNFI